jgi:hypothetical protein
MIFDFEVEQIEPGTTVEQSTIEAVLGMKRQGNEYAYQFALMQFGEFVQRSLWRMGKHYTVRTSGGEVQVLTHEEASKYNDSRFDLAIEKMRRCNRRLIAVDVAELSAEARADHGAAMVRQSRILGLVKGVKKCLELNTESPKRPPIPSGQKRDTSGRVGLGAAGKGVAGSGWAGNG